MEKGLMKRDLCIRKETCKGMTQSTAKELQIASALNVFILSKETYKKRPLQMKRDQWKEIYEKRPVYMKRDL